MKDRNEKGGAREWKKLEDNDHWVFIPLDGVVYTKAFITATRLGAIDAIKT